MDDYGYRIAYIALEPGTPVVTSDGQQIGTVKQVLADFQDDIFEGLNIETADGDRFIDEEQIDDICERAVVLALSSEELANLPGR